MDNLFGDIEEHAEKAEEDSKIGTVIKTEDEDDRATLTFLSKPKGRAARLGYCVAYSDIRDYQFEEMKENMQKADEELFQDTRSMGLQEAAKQIEVPSRKDIEKKYVKREDKELKDDEWNAFKSGHKMCREFQSHESLRGLSLSLIHSSMSDPAMLTFLLIHGDVEDFKERVSSGSVETTIF